MKIWHYRYLIYLYQIVPIFDSQSNIPLNLHYMYTSPDKLTTCTIHKAGVYMNRYLLVERKAILHANQ